MLEVIKRCEGKLSEKEQINGQVQVSYNDYGHLVIRIIHGTERDTLIVLNESTSYRVIDFCQNRIRNIRKTNDEKLPF
jgi:hypothetical protein